MRRRFVALWGAALLIAAPAAAGTLAMNFSNTEGQPLSNPPMTLGWIFNVNTPIQVTALSFFDSGQDGLAESHGIGLWTPGGTLLASATVQAGTVNPLNDKFRTVSVAPVLLAPGAYRIGAHFATGNDPNMFPTFTQNFATAPEIAYVQAANIVGGTLANPNPFPFSMGPSYFGPNFEFQAVPEPSAMIPLGLALVAVGYIGRRRASVLLP